MPVLMSIFAHPATWLVVVLLVIGATVALGLHRQSRLRRRLDDAAAVQAQYRMILDQMPAIVWTVDERFVFTSISGAGMADLGATPEQMIGHSIYKYFQTSDRAFKPIAAHEDAVRLEKSDTYDVTWQRRTYHVRVEPWRDSGGQVCGAVGVALDITPRVRAEEALAVSESRNRALLMAIPDVMFRLNRNGIILEFIDNLTAPADVVGSHISRQFPAHIVEQMTNRVAAAIQTTQVQTFEYATGLEDKPHYFEARVVVCGADEALVIVRNITGQKRRENDLRQSESELKAFLAALPDHIVQVRRDGRIAGIFAPRGRMLLPAEQVLGRSVADFLPPEQAQPTLDAIGRVLDTGEEHISHSTLEINGQTASYEARFVPDPNRSEQVILLVREMSTITVQNN